MNWRYAIVAGGLVLLALGVFALQGTPEETAVEARRRAVVERIERSDVGGAHDHDHGGEHAQAERKLPDHPLSGIEREDVSEHPPLNDAEAWRQQRAKTALELHEGQVAATRAFAASEGLSQAQTDAIVATIDGFHTTLRDLKQQIEAGQLPAAELRKRTPQLRQEVAAAIRAEIGPLPTGALRQHLADAQLGGGF